MARKAKGGEHDKDNEHEDEVEAPAEVEVKAVRAQEPGKGYEGQATIELLETTDAEDINSLSAAIVALIQDAAWDDMTWPEVDRALRLTSHEIRQNWSATGTVKPAPPPEPDPPEDEGLTRMEGESDEDFASRKRAVRARHASGLESLSPAPRSRYEG
jgi:hypothetical protein